MWLSQQRIAEFLIAQRWLLFGFAVVFSLIAWGTNSNPGFDRRIEQLFPDQSQATRAYRELKQAFGGNEVAMLMYSNANLFDVDGQALGQQELLAEQIEALPGVQSVLSFAKLNALLARIRPPSLFAAEDAMPAILEDEPLPEAFRDLFVQYTHSIDGRYAAMVVILDPRRPIENGSDLAIEGLRRIADAIPSHQQPVSLVGEPVLISEGFSLAEADGQRLGMTTIVLLSTVMLVAFRSFRWVIAQSLVIWCSVVCTETMIQWFGLQLTLVSSMLTAVITVIAVASIVHIAVTHRDMKRRGLGNREATAIAIERVIRPIGWACVTDAVGFAALSISGVGPIRDFGVMMAIGALVVFLAIVMLVPCLGIIGTQSRVLPTSRTSRLLRRKSHAAFEMLLLQRRWVFVSLIAATVGIAVGLGQLTIETNFILSFRSQHRLAIDYRNVEQNLGGAGVWDILLPAPKELTQAYLDSVRELERRLHQIGDEPDERLTKVISIADADAAAQASPLLSLATPAIRIAGMRAALPDFIDALITPPNVDDSTRRLRIMLRSNEQVSASTKQRLINHVRRTVANHTNTSQWRQLFASGTSVPEAQVTGYYVLLTQLVESLVSDQWLCFAVASVGIFASIVLATASVRLAICAMLPNLLPILAVMAILGFTGTPVNLGTAMIAAVSIGISIDGSIHFLHAYQWHRATHRPRVAIARVYRGVGIAVILATVSLTIGFSTLISSPFIPTATFGLLVSATLILSSLANLTLLPVAILVVADRNAR
ncbi:MAG: MMPL family transporter [Pirellulaceae bacterium]